MDTASGGFDKTPHPQIFIELPEEQAIEYFERRFGQSPYNITCECCGEDYAVFSVTTTDHAGGNDLIISFEETQLS